MSPGDTRDAGIGVADILRDLAAVVDRVGAGGTARTRAVRDAGGAVDRAMWRRFGELGWLGLGVPEELGGAGAGERAVATVAGRLGAGGLPEPFAACAVRVGTLLSELAGSPGRSESPGRDGARRLLDDVVAGTRIVTLAHDPDAPAPTLTGDGAGGHVLAGRVRWVPVPEADTVLLVATAGPHSEEAIVLVARDEPGLRVTTVALADGGHLADLEVDGVAVPSAGVLACGPEALRALDVAGDAALVAVSAELTGIAGRVLDMTCEYLRTREQFGRPIGAFQSLAHRAVDMWIQCRLARAALDGALQVRELPGATDDERSAAASSAKARASEAASWVGRQAVQLHGALGFSDEHDLGLFLNRALVLASWLGGPDVHRLRHDALSPRPEPSTTPAEPRPETAHDAGGSVRRDLTRPDRPDVAGGPGGPVVTTFGVPQERDWNALTDEQFRAVVRAEFEAHYPSSIRYPPRRLYWSEQSAWFERMSAKGWIAPNWPARYGGMGLGPSKLLVFGEEQERWGIARFQDQGVRMIGPALFEHGTPEQLDRFLPGILSCADRYCQGYSEPGAGSDLASLRTRARRDGDHYVVDGSKIWTTMAHDVTHMVLLARTDPDAARQRGISFFLLELDVPGVTVRPIRDIAGHQELCEVFFDGVRVPAGNRIGPENQGWTVGKSVLSAERIHIGSPQMPAYALDRLDRVARARGVAEDPVFRSRFAALALDVAHLSDAYAGFAAVFVRGEPLGPDVSMLKIWATETTQRIGELIRDTAGPAGAVVGPVGAGEGSDVDVLDVFYKALPSTIYGGSNEIQRSIIATQVLGLPSS